MTRRPASARSVAITAPPAPEPTTTDVAALVEAAREVAAVDDGLGRGDLAAHGAPPSARRASAARRRRRDGARAVEAGRGELLALLEGGDGERAP